MMNENQRRILAEAVKYGGTNTSKIEQMAKSINEEVLAEARKMGKRQLRKAVDDVFNKHFNGVPVPLMKLVAIFKEIEAAIVSGADPEKAMAEIKKKHGIAEEVEVTEANDKIKLVKEMGSKTLYQYGFNYYIVSYSSMGGETAIFMADSSGKPKSYESLWSERRSVDHDSAIKDFVKYKFKKDAVVESTEIAEEPVLTGGEAAPTLFGWSKHQFEAKFRELLTRMGFERGIIHIKTEGQEMKMYFANAAKARDFVVAFNGLARRKSMGSVASVATQFNKIKSPTGTNAIVSLDLSMVRGESLDLDGTDLYEWFSEETETITEGYERVILNYLDDAGFKKGDAWFENGILYVAKRNLIARAKTALKNKRDIYKLPEIKLDPDMKEETVSEGGVKAALADFMEGLPKEMVADIRKIIKLSVVNTTEAVKRKNKIEAIRKKYKIAPDFMGTPTWKIIVDYFNTFHGESVEVNEARWKPMGSGTWRKVGPEFDTDVEAEKFLLSKGFKKTRMDDDGEVGYRKGRTLAYIATDTLSGHQVMMKEEVEMEAYGNPFTPSVPGTFAAPNFRGGLKAGDKVKVPHKGKMVSGKIVRFDSGGTDKARQHGGGYVVDVGEPASILVPAHKVVVEEVDQFDESLSMLSVSSLKNEANRLLQLWYHTKRNPTNYPNPQSPSLPTIRYRISELHDELMERGVNDPRLMAILKTTKEEVEVTEQLANYRAFHAKTGQQITVQASSTQEAEAKAVEALKAANKKSVYVRYLGPVKEEVEVTESVEEDGEELTEAQQVIGKYRFTSFTEGSVKGWLISVQGMGEVGFVSEPAKRNTKMSVAPHQVFFHKSFQGAGNPSLMANFYPGTETRVPNEKEVRFAPRQLLKAVAMWMDKYGYEKIDHAKKEEVEEGDGEITESTPNPYDQRIIKAKEIAKKIKDEAKARGVRVYPSADTVVTATKDFPKGDLAAFMKAYRDCDMVLTHMRFTSNGNQWGCESAGFGIGAQECVKAGRVTINKSGGGGQLIIKALEGKLGTIY